MTMNQTLEPLGQADALAKHKHHCNHHPKWAAKIENKLVPSPGRRVEVKVLKDLGNIALGNNLVRDLGGQHDEPLKNDQTIDLAEGNVFYGVPECQAPKPTGHHAPPKLAFFVDGRPEETPRCESTGHILRELFGFTPDAHLFRDCDSPDQVPINLDETVRFADGPVFYTRMHHVPAITITINGKPYELHEHKVQVKELKKLAGIPLADVLVEIVNGQMKPLDDNSVVELRCGEVFISHPKDNASS